MNRSNVSRVTAGPGGGNKAGKLSRMQKERANRILERLGQCYPAAGTALHFKTPFELLVAAILSAQSTDQQVNRVTSRLFEKYKHPRDFAGLTPEELAGEIKGVGLYRNKSKYIVAASKEILNRHGGRVPETRSDLEALPGVGRKTAGVVLGVAFGGSALPVDTHVFRVARRLGFSRAGTPEKVEADLFKFVAPDQGMAVHHRLIAHGRGVCKARKPACFDCFLKDLCRYPGQGGDPACTSSSSNRKSRPIPAT